MDRITIAVDDMIGSAVRKAAARSGLSLSAWLAKAAEAQLRNQLLSSALDEYESDHGAFTAAELAEAEAFFEAPAGRWTEPAAPR